MTWRSKPSRQELAEIDQFFIEFFEEDSADVIVDSVIGLNETGIDSRHGLVERMLAYTTHLGGRGGWWNRIDIARCQCDGGNVIGRRGSDVSLGESRSGHLIGLILVEHHRVRRHGHRIVGMRVVSENTLRLSIQLNC